MTGVLHFAPRHCRRCPTNQLVKWTATVPTPSTRVTVNAELGPLHFQSSPFPSGAAFHRVQARYLASDTGNWNHTPKHGNQQFVSKPTSSPSRPTTDNQRVLLQQTESLLQIPQLSWTLDHWRLAEESLYAWTKHNAVSRESVQWSFRLLDRMVDEAEHQQPADLFPLTIQHVHCVLDHWRIGSRSRGVINWKQLSATKIWRIVENYADRIPTLYLDTKAYSMIMAVQIKQNPAKSPEICSQIIHKMKSKPFATTTTTTATAVHHAKPNAIALTYLMDAHVKGGQSNATFATQAIFDFMVEKAEQDPDLAPTEKSLTRLLQAWVGLSNATPQEAIPHMKRALQIMIDASKKNNPSVLPNSLFLNLVLDHCSRLDKVQSTSSSSSTCTIPLADALMTLVYDMAKFNNYTHLIPDPKAFCRLIDMWSHSKLPDAPIRAEYWLDEMCQLSQTLESFPPPRASVYSAVLAAWEQSSSEQAPIRGEAIWKRMVHETSEVTAGGYHMLISMWSKQYPLSSSSSSSSPRPDSTPLRAEEILREMLTASETDTRLVPFYSSFLKVIIAWEQHASVDSTAAPRAHDILRLLLDQVDCHPDKFPQLDNIPFDTVLNAWAQSGLPDADTHAMAVLEWMEQQQQQQQDSNIKATVNTIWNILQCLSPNSPNLAQNLNKLQTYLQNADYNQKNSVHQRDKIYERFMWLWVNSAATADAPLQAEALLESYRNYPDGKSPHKEYLVSCMGHVVFAWSKMDSVESSAKLKCWLAQMELEADLCYKHTKKLDAIANLADAWARSNLPEARHRVNSILTRLSDLCTQQGMVPDPSWYDKVILSFVEHESIEQAVAVYSKASEENLAGDLESNSILIESLSESGDSKYIHRATSMVAKMVERYLEDKRGAKPSTDIFGPLMSIYASKKDSQQVEYLWSLLQALQKSFPGDTAFQPNAEVLLALCCNDKIGAREDSMLHHLLVAGRQGTEMAMFHGVLDALARSGGNTAGRRAEVILLRMQELYDEGKMSESPNFATFQKVINCWVNSGDDGAAERADDVLNLAENLAQDGDLSLQPNCQGFMIVIQAWAKSHAPDAPERIQALMRKMKERHTRGERDFHLDGTAFTALIEAYANSGHPEASKLALAVFEATPEEFRNTELFNALIGAQGGDSTGAEAILDGMHKEYLAGNENVQPNTESFNQVLQAWSRSGSPMAAWRADGIFQRMTALSDSGKLPVKPNGRTFDLVISTLANEFGADGALKVDRYLSLLKDYYMSGEPDCSPSVTSYTEAIRAWGSNIEDPRAVLRAKALLDEMHEMASQGVHSVKPDRKTYGAYLQALSKSNTEEKMELAKDVASSMERDGIVPDGTLLEQLQRCCLPSHAILTGWAIMVDENTFQQNEEFPIFS